MPVLRSHAEAGGWCRQGAIGVMPSSTYPNHATFVTGVTPERHGILANEIPTDRGVVPSWELGPSVPTLFDAMRAGQPVERRRLRGPPPGRGHRCGRRRLGLAGGRPGRRHRPGHPRVRQGSGDGRGGGPGRCRRCRAGGGPVQRAGHRGTRLRPRQPGGAAPVCPGRTRTWARSWSRSATSGATGWPIVVSDHSQESVTETDPVDLRAAAGAAGLAGTVVDDGAVALVGGELAGRSRMGGGGARSGGRAAPRCHLVVGVVRPRSLLLGGGGPGAGRPRQPPYRGPDRRGLRWPSRGQAPRLLAGPGATGLHLVGPRPGRTPRARLAGGGRGRIRPAGEGRPTPTGWRWRRRGSGDRPHLRSRRSGPRRPGPPR